MSVCRLLASLSGVNSRVRGFSATKQQQRCCKHWSDKHVQQQRPLSTSSVSCGVEDNMTMENTTTTSRTKNKTSSPVLQIQNAVLQYPNSSHFSLSIPWLEIGAPGSGGHAVLGTNGSGKSLLASTVTRFRGAYGYNDPAWLCWPRHVAAVSFDTHQELLRENPSVFAAISDHTGHLSKAAQFLVVRFGLFGLLTRNVHTLSTGEIRKVLLIRALSQLSSPASASSPSSKNANTHNLLILDNAFDGLCVQSREILKEIVRKTIRGFRNDILVQAVSAKATLPTQVVLITHRSEEIVDEISRVTLLHNHHHEHHHHRAYARTYERNNRTVQQLFHMALYPNSTDEVHDLQRPIVHKDLWENDEDAMPSRNEIRSWWESADLSASHHASHSRASSSKILVHAEHFKIFGSENSTTCLIDDLNWIVESGQRWWIAGGNGAGKSSLSRALIRSQQQQSPQNQNHNATLHQQHDGFLHIPFDHAHRLGWVSTELHMTTAKKSVLARDVLLHADSAHPVPVDVGQTVARWLQIPDPWLMQPFSHLSQGQQKIVLIAAALARRPKLLILDEPLQGCDGIFRRRVLSLVERLAISIDEFTLIYITHHPEEVLPCISHVLELERGKCVYQGTRPNYEQNRKAALLSEQESQHEQQEHFQEFF
jgi:molybdate transport system ATP-binding protein